MPVQHLNQERIDSSTRRYGRAYTIRDRGCKGLHLEVAKSGRKTFKLCVIRDGIKHVERIGDASVMPLDEARAIANDRIDALTVLEQAGPETPFETVAEAVMQRMRHHWSPGTMEVSRTYLKSTILPFFGGRSIGSVTRADVEEWFAGLHMKPGAANRSAPILSTIMREAEEMGARPVDSNPVHGIRRYRRPKKERRLTPEELARLGRVLDRWEERYPVKIAFLRLTILTGCRKGELRHLRWKDYRGGKLHLPSSKTGPKTIHLSSHARAVLDGLKTPRSGPVFPSVRKQGIPINMEHFWIAIRKEAGLDDVRLHDLRHNYASTAIKLKQNLATVGTLLGHSDPDSTLRYTHLDDDTMLDAADRVGGCITGRNHGAVQ